MISSWDLNALHRRSLNKLYVLHCDKNDERLMSWRFKFVRINGWYYLKQTAAFYKRINHTNFFPGDVLVAFSHFAGAEFQKYDPKIYISIYNKSMHRSTPIASLLKVVLIILQTQHKRVPQKTRTEKKTENRKQVD